MSRPYPIRAVNGGQSGHTRSAAWLARFDYATVMQTRRYQISNKDMFLAIMKGL